MAEVNTARYFCPASCEDLTAEQPRDTGKEYFGPTDDESDELESSETAQQQNAGVVKTEAKPEPGTFYSIPETCFSGIDIYSYRAAAMQARYSHERSGTSVCQTREL